MELVAILYWVIGVLSILLITAILLCWKHVWTTLTRLDEMPDNRARTQTETLINESDERLLYDMFYRGEANGALPGNLISNAEMTRRLMVELRKLHYTTI